MKNEHQHITTISTVKDLHAFLGLPAPLNPLITLINHADSQAAPNFSEQKLVLALYNISIKRSFKGILKYGKSQYDFDEGTMSFIAPNQVISVDAAENRNGDGWSLLFHPDLIRRYPLGKTIKSYGFFAYSVNEALHLSGEEDQTVEAIIQNIAREINSRLDHFSQDLIVSNIDLLLGYCNRFYGRQFITRKMVNNNLLADFENELASYFMPGSSAGLPTVEGLSAALHVTPAYLSDMLRNATGQNTQQHIHEQLIVKAKELLTTTNHTISEIAYELGFHYTQSFSKLFKSKTSLTPGMYRKSYN